MEGTEKVLLAHSNDEFSSHFSMTLGNCGWGVSCVKSIKEMIKTLESSEDFFRLVGIPLEDIALDEVGSIGEILEEPRFKETKIFAVIAASTRFSQVILEKIKTLKPRDFVSENCTSDEIVFRLNNVLYEDNGIRKNYRALVKMTVHCDYMQDFFDAESFTISKDGIFLKTDRTFPADAKIFLTFKLPISQKDFATMGSLLYSINDSSPKPRVSPPGSGLYFVDLNNEERDSIDRYVRGSA